MRIVDPHTIELAVELARELLEQANQLQTPAERRQQAELDRMLQTPADKTTVVQLTDQAFRSRAASRTVEHLTHILDVQGIPRFFSPFDRALLRGFQSFGGWLPGVAVPLVKNHMRHETANVVLPAEHELLVEHLAARRAEGVRMNLNFLGESLLGEAEASRRLEKYLEALQLPEVEVLSVKISTLYSQIAPQAREHTLRILGDRLELLYRESAHLEYVLPDGRRTRKFVYLDMEEYRDLELTAAVFQRTLDRPGLESCSAGIALQAYIPDSADVQRRIYDWARQRVARGGAPITVRLVKGANLEAERVEASQRGWPQAPFLTKRETDANYKRMLHEAFRPENLAAARLGVASHNLFDLAYGLLLAQRANAGDRVQFEMLEGMANSLRRAIVPRATGMLLYAPACRKDEFLNAIGYLLRRLDENTGPENFLRHAFRLTPDSEDWQLLADRFRESFTIEVSDKTRRTQNRLLESLVTPRREMMWQSFENEPDTDFSLPANSIWAEQIVAATSESSPNESSRNRISAPWPSIITPTTLVGPMPSHADATVADWKATGRTIRECVDPSRPGVVLCHYVEAQAEDIDESIRVARQDPANWRGLTCDARSEILGQVAAQLRQARGRLLRAAVANGGKTIVEGDPEVSEAIDFVEFYRSTTRYFHELSGVQATGRGVIVVVPPWNFPLAIPCGGIAAALAAGNTVIVKPASDTVLVAWELCECFWRAGVPRSALQFATCPGSGVASRLIQSDQVDAVILTGGTSTALKMLAAKPTLRLFAETGGKNATIVTALSDRELAIKHIVQSAFGHGGQKCSATSLLLLEAEVYDDPEFRRMLCDAVESWTVGSVWDLPTRMGPLIRPPAGALEEALKTLEPGEQWAVLPRQFGDNPRLWSPGVKYGVTSSSVTHHTEFFGPLLGVMRFERLEEAIDIVNMTGYGLTSGLHSLDDREHELWKRRIRAGNLYINRGTTGAIVLRQPFGGQGRSVFGPGLKAGGPNYVAQFLKIQEIESPDATPHRLESPMLAALAIALRNAHELLLASAVTAHIERAMASYESAWREEFSRDHDHFRLIGQDNLRRYLPFASIRVRVTPADSPFEIVARVAAGRLTGARVVVSYCEQCYQPLIEALDRWTDPWAGGIEFWRESDAELAAWLGDLPAHADDRLRYAAPDRVPSTIRQVAAETGCYIADEPVTGVGRIELLWYLREQSVCYDYHRYGNLGIRAAEPRAAVS